MYGHWRDVALLKEVGDIVFVDTSSDACCEVNECLPTYHLASSSVFIKA